MGRARVSEVERRSRASVDGRRDYPGVSRSSAERFTLPPRTRRSARFDAVHHRTGQLLYQLDADPARPRRGRGGPQDRRRIPSSLVTNILTEGRGMRGFSVGEAVRRVGEAIGRPVDVVHRQQRHRPQPERASPERYAERAQGASPDRGDTRENCQLVTGHFWQGQIARHCADDASRMQSGASLATAVAAVAAPRYRASRRASRSTCARLAWCCPAMRVACVAFADFFFLRVKDFHGRALDHRSRQCGRRAATRCGRRATGDPSRSGMSAARISSKSPSLLTLSGANSVMSTRPRPEVGVLDQ